MTLLRGQFVPEVISSPVALAYDKYNYTKFHTGWDVAQDNKVLGSS